MMLKGFTKYLIVHKQVALPGIGNFYIETKPAQIDFANRSITSKENKIVFSNDKPEPEGSFYTFLSEELKTDEPAAKQAFDAFALELKNELNTQKTVHLKGIGTLTRESAANISFEPEAMPVYFPALVAEKVIRKHTAHTVRVGEDEKSSEEMQAVLQQAHTGRKEKWWIAASILALAGIAAIVFYYTVYQG